MMVGKSNLDAWSEWKIERSALEPRPPHFPSFCPPSLVWRLRPAHPCHPLKPKKREAYLPSHQAVSQHIWILEATQEERRERPRPRNTSPAIKQELAHEVRSDARYTTIVRWLSMCTQAYFYPPTSKLLFCILIIIFMIENMYANKLVTHPSLKLHFARCFILRSSCADKHTFTHPHLDSLIKGAIVNNKWSDTEQVSKA